MGIKEVWLLVRCMSRIGGVNEWDGALDGENDGKSVLLVDM